MEGPLQIKDSTSTVEESVKSEEILQNSDNNERSEAAASPPPHCSICLGKLINTSFTDSCLHQFCFTCLLQWSKIKTECPLCKQTFKSIIHNVRSEEDYDQYHVPRELASQISQPQVMAMDDHWDGDIRRFLYRTTMIGNRRQGALLNPEQVARREQLPSMAPQVSRVERRRRRANPTDYRRTVYRHGLWATPLPDVFGRFRECSAEYYRQQPHELQRLIPWINRELQVLLNHNAPHITYVMSCIMDALSQYDIRSSQFRSLMHPYFGAQTEHFIHELLNYARTNFDLVGYDQCTTYLPQGLSNEYVSHVISPTPSNSSHFSDDSDVRILDQAIDLRMNAQLPNVVPLQINMPGPSTVAQTFQLDISYNVPDVLILSSNSSDDECEVIGYVKPRHERTPEIIELISSSEETSTPCTSQNNTESQRPASYEDTPQPSTSYNSRTELTRKTKNETSQIKVQDLSDFTTSESDWDRDYSPRRSNLDSSKRNSKIKRRKSTNTRSRVRMSRNISSSDESDSRKRSTKGSNTYAAKKKFSSCSDSSAQGDKRKQSSEAKSKKEKCSTKVTVHIRKDLIKREERYSENESLTSSSSCSSSSSSSSSSGSSSSSSSSSSEKSNENKKSHKSRTKKKSKRKYSTNSNYHNTEETEKINKYKNKLRHSPDETSSPNDCIKKEHKYRERRRSVSTSGSESSYVLRKNKRFNRRKREFKRKKMQCYNQNNNELINCDTSKREHLTKTRNVENSSDSEDSLLSSQYSSYSNKSYTHYEISKHKDKYKDKLQRLRTKIGDTRSKSYNLNHISSNVLDSMASVSPKNETYSIPKHSDSKSGSNSKEKYKLPKIIKIIKRRKVIKS